MRDDRYKEMLLITSVVQDYLKQFLADEIMIERYFQDYNISLNYMFNRRLNKNIWLRPYVCAMVFKQYNQLYLNNDELINPIIVPALTVSEVFNISTYQSNIVFDDKIKNEYISNVNQFISSFISFNLAIHILNKVNLPPEKVLSCINILNECNKTVYIGQYIDLNVLVTKNTSNILSMSENEYIKFYLDRCKKIGGTTVDTCAAWAYIIAGKSNHKELSILRGLFQTWGQLMQMANDLSDYTIFINQKDYVRYTDIRAGKITLPFYYILQTMPQNSALSFVKTMNELDDVSLDQFFQEYLYVDSDIIKKVFLVMESLWKACRDQMRSLGLDKNSFRFLFENAFLTKFSRCFFSNQLIKHISK